MFLFGQTSDGSGSTDGRQDGPNVGAARGRDESRGVSMGLVGGIIGGFIFIVIVFAALVVYGRRHGWFCFSVPKEESIYETVEPSAVVSSNQGNAYSNNAYDNIPAPIVAGAKTEGAYDKPKLDPKNNSFANAIYDNAPDKKQVKLYPKLSKGTLKEAASKERGAAATAEKPPIDTEDEVNDVNAFREKSLPPPPYSAVAEDNGHLPPKY